jgi:hypothetical protein
MMKDLKGIEEMFKDAFDGFSVNPDPSIKTSIDKRLFKKSGKRTFGFWLFLFLAFFGLLALVQRINGTNNADYIEKNTANKTLKEKKIRKNIKKHIKNPDKQSFEKATKTADNKSNSLELKTNVKIAKNKIHAAIKANDAVLKSCDEKVSMKIKHTENKMLNTRYISKENSLLLREKHCLPNYLMIIKAIKSIDNRIEKHPIFTLKILDSIFNASEERKTVNKKQRSLTLFANYSYQINRFNNEKPNYEKYESGIIRTASINARIEYRKVISHSFTLQTGLGFSQNFISQKGQVTIWDSIPGAPINPAGASPTVFIPSHLSDEVQYRLQQIQLGIGVSYTRLLYHNWNLELSFGSDFSIGKLREKAPTTNFEAPELSDLGVSCYLRPTLEYKLANYSILAFGQIHQILRSQINWSYLKTRNPYFGGGIAFRYHF